MIAITVDDERPMLNALTDIVKSSPDIDVVYDFSACTSALEWVSDNDVDVAFLDINMRYGGTCSGRKNCRSSSTMQNYILYRIRRICA